MHHGLRSRAWHVLLACALACPSPAVAAGDEPRSAAPRAARGAGRVLPVTPLVDAPELCRWTASEGALVAENRSSPVPRADSAPTAAAEGLIAAECAKLPVADAATMRAVPRPLGGAALPDLASATAWWLPPHAAPWSLVGAPSDQAARGLRLSLTSGEGSTLLVSMPSSQPGAAWVRAPELAAVVDVVAGAPSPSASLVNASSLSVTVKDSAGKAVRGAVVAAIAPSVERTPAGDSWEARLPAHLALATPTACPMAGAGALRACVTDETGTCTMTLAPGEWSVSAVAPHDLCAPAVRATLITGAASRVELRATASCSRVVLVADDRGTAVQGAELRRLDDVGGGEPVLVGPSDDVGLVPAEEPCDVDLQVLAAGHVSARLPGRGARPLERVVLTRTGSIAVDVADFPDPAPPPSPCQWELRPLPAETVTGQVGQPADQRASLRGTVTLERRMAIEDVPPGAWVLRLAHDELGTATSDAIVVAPGERSSGGALAFTPTVSVSGLVIDSTDDTGIAGARAWLDEDAESAVVAGPGGEFVLRRVEPGAHRLHASAEGYVQLEKDALPLQVNDSDREVAGRLVRLTPTASLELTLADAVGPVEGAIACLTEAGSFTTDCRITDRFGRATWEDLAPGVVQVALPPCYESRDVQLAPGEKGKLDTTLPGVTMGGNIKRNGVATPGIVVGACSARRWSSLADAAARQAHASYVLPGLEQGAPLDVIVMSMDRSDAGQAFLSQNRVTLEPCSVPRCGRDIDLADRGPEKASAPCTDVRGRLISSVDGTGLGGWTVAAIGVMAVATEADGSFAMCLPSGGTHGLRGYSSLDAGMQGIGIVSAPVTEIDLENGAEHPVDGVQVFLEPTPSVTLRVLDAAGRPASGVTCAVMDPACHLGCCWVARADAAGRCVLRGRTTGTLHVLVSGAQAGTWARSVEPGSGVREQAVALGRDLGNVRILGLPDDDAGRIVLEGEQLGALTVLQLETWAAPGTASRRQSDVCPHCAEILVSAIPAGILRVSSASWSRVVEIPPGETVLVDPR